MLIVNNKTSYNNQKNNKKYFSKNNSSVNKISNVKGKPQPVNIISV
jgi:hypothetical protein